MSYKRENIILLSLLALLNFILRIPWMPHEIGWDSFKVHSLINSISQFGEARWWINPMSIVGSYPYSDPSAVPFLLSGISQVSGIDVGTAILLYNLITGLMSIFFAYIMAGIIWNNDIFKFFVAFIFSTSQGMVTFSTWTVNARTLFVFLMPVFIYILLKTRKDKLRFSILTVLMFALLTATHHLIYFTIPILASYLGLIVLYFLPGKIKKVQKIKLSENFISLFLFGTFLLMFIASFFTGTFMETDPNNVGSRYGWMSVLVESYTRYIGIPIIFVIGGYTYLLFKKEKKFEEIFLLLSIAAIAPLLYNETYSKWFVITFASLLIAIGLTNVTRLNISDKLKRYKNPFITVLLVLSIVFVGYYQFLHFLNDPSPTSRYLEESTYRGAEWSRNSIDKNMISEPYIRSRILSISQVPLLSGYGPSDLAYGFVRPEELKVEQIYKPASLGFYVNDPYKSTGIRTDRAADDIVRKTGAEKLISKFKISYYVENRDLPMALDLHVKTSDDKVYDNGRIRIWSIK